MAMGTTSAKADDASGSGKAAQPGGAGAPGSGSRATADSRDVTGDAAFTAASTDEARRLGSQPEGLEPMTQRVAMVSRDASGHATQADNFVVMVPEGASDAERDAQWNRAGEAQGSKHLSGGACEEPPPVSGWLTGFSDEEWAKRADTERRELHRHNFREDAS